MNKKVGRKAGPKIPEKIVEILQAIDLPVPVRRIISESYNVHINQVNKIIRGEAPFTKDNKLIIRAMITLILCKMYENALNFDNQIVYIISDQYKADMKTE